MLCIAGAPSVEGYQELFTNDGFNLVHQENASGYLAKLLSEIETKVAAFKYECSRATARWTARIPSHRRFQIFSPRPYRSSARSRP